jgi:hypothetical protein
MLKNMALIIALLTVSVCIHAETLDSDGSGTLTIRFPQDPIILIGDTIADPTINPGLNLWNITVGAQVINPEYDLTSGNANSGSTGNLALQPGGTLTLIGTGSLNLPTSQTIQLNQGTLTISGDARLSVDNSFQGNDNVTINIHSGTLSLGQIDDSTRFDLGNITQTGGLIVSNEGFKLEHGQLNLSGGTLRTHTNAADLYFVGSTVSGGSLTNPINFTAGSTGMLQVENGTADFFDAFITGGLIQIDNTVQTDTSKFLIVEVNDGGKTYQQLTLAPEPATMSLLVIGGLAVLRRRRGQS